MTTAKHGFKMLPYQSGRYHQKLGRRHKKLTVWARQMILSA